MKMKRRVGEEEEMGGKLLGKQQKKKQCNVL